MRMQGKLRAYAPVAMTLFLAQEQLWEQLQALLTRQQPVPAVTTTLRIHNECLCCEECDIRDTKGKTLLSSRGTAYNHNKPPRCIPMHRAA